jgi:putative peptidoglycan lipid II flippase
MKKSFVNVLIVSGLTLLSQLIGYLREMIFAYYLGTSMSLEAFQTAETVPLTFTQILISAVPLAFTPMLIREQKDKEEKLIHNAIFMFGIIMLFISIGVFSFSNVFVRILAPGFEGEKLLLTARIVTTYAKRIHL